MGEKLLENGVLLRDLRSEEEFDACVDLQRATWGEAFSELVPPAILMITQKIGGVVAGALDPRGELLGFVYGMTGIRERRVAHWSHMLAVTDSAKGMGLGRELKLYQREELCALGVEVMFWTYDPLVVRNANLNLNRLGALPEKYVRDMYGPDTGSSIHSALGTDRFIVRWELGSSQVRERIEAAAAKRVVTAPGPDRPDSPLIVNAQLDSGRPTPVEETLPDEDVVWIEVPGDIEREKAERPEEAMAWRATSRRAFEHYLARSFSVRGLTVCDGEVQSPDSRRFFYRLERTA